MFKLKRPCSDCPFRKGNGERFALPDERIAGIVRADAFQCHKTVDYSIDDADENAAVLRQGDKPQQCAGIMAILHREGLENQIMQVAERLGVLNPDELDPMGEAYDNLSDALTAHRRGCDGLHRSSKTNGRNGNGTVRRTVDGDDVSCNGKRRSR